MNYSQLRKDFFDFLFSKISDNAGNLLVHLRMHLYLFLEIGLMITVPIAGFYLQQRWMKTIACPFK